MHMDPLDSILPLISNALSCVFMGMQYLHVIRHPEVLPFISVSALSFLNLGHILQLAPNLPDSLLWRGPDHQQYLVFGTTDGWLKVHEWILRFLSMFGFILQFRLLQLAWSSRTNKSDGKAKALWFMEKVTLLLSLPFYVTTCCLMILLQNWSKDSMEVKPKFFAEVLFDVFLLPQILLNLLSDSKESALSDYFYIGTTSLRLLHHGSAIYRGYSLIVVEKHSLTWDIIISYWCLFFAVLVYWQQRHGWHLEKWTSVRRPGDIGYWS